MVDAKYLKGPMPVLRAARALRALAAGTKLRVLATHPGAVADFHDFCRDNGHALVSWSEMKGVYSFTIRRGEARGIENGEARGIEGGEARGTEGGKPRSAESLGV